MVNSSLKLCPANPRHIPIPLPCHSTAPPPCAPSVIVIENLKGVQNDCLHHLGLPARIPHIPGLPLTHQRGPEHDCQVTGRHSVLPTMLRHLIQMQRQLPQGGIIRIWQVIDNGMHRVAANNVVVDSGCAKKRRVVCRGEQRVREVT